MANLSLPSLAREPAAAFLCRPGAASSLARLVLPEACEIELAGHRTATLRPSGLDQQAATALLSAAQATCEVLAMPAMGPGLLLVERRLARCLVTDLLGLPIATDTSPLSRVERGMLGGLVAGALCKLGLSCGIQLALTDAPEVGPDAIALEVLARLRGEEGRVWVCATPSALRRSWEGALRSSGRSPAVLRLELAETRLPRSEADGALEGDIVVFDEMAALSSSSSWPVQMCYGGRRTWATLGPDGRVWADAQTATAPLRASGERTRSSAAEWVEVTAEIAHTPAADPLGPEPTRSARGDGILLRLGEADWAEGVLCEVAGRLAVRITRTLAG